MDFRNCLKVKNGSGFFEHFYFGDHVLSIQVEEDMRLIKATELTSFNVACWKCESHGEGESFGPFVPLRNILLPEVATQWFAQHDVPSGLTVEETQMVFDSFIDYAYRYLKQFR